MIEASEAEIERVVANAKAEDKYAWSLSEEEQRMIEESEAEIQRAAEAEAENKRLIEKAVAAINGKAELKDHEIERYFAFLSVQEETLYGYNRGADVVSVVVSDDEDENEVDCNVVSEDEDEDEDEDEAYYSVEEDEDEVATAVAPVFVLPKEFDFSDGVNLRGVYCELWPADASF